MDWLERVAPGFEREDIGGKGVFRTNRLAVLAGSNWPFVDAARNPIIIGPWLPEVLLKEGKCLLFEVEPGFDSEPVHFCCRRQPDTIIR